MRQDSFHFTSSSKFVSPRLCYSRGTILNISISGAKITLRPNPGLFVGALVRIGSRLATVVRAIEGGIAVQFVEPFPADNFDERIRP